MSGTLDCFTLLPVDFRERHGVEMARLFGEMWRTRRRDLDEEPEAETRALVRSLERQGAP